MKRCQCSSIFFQSLKIADADSENRQYARQRSQSQKYRRELSWFHQGTVRGTSAVLARSCTCTGRTCSGGMACTREGNPGIRFHWALNSPASYTHFLISSRLLTLFSVALSCAALNVNLPGGHRTDF